MKIESYQYDPTKSVIQLPGKIYGPTAKRNIRFVFDPGAYRTIIATRLMDVIGYQANLHSRRVTTTSVIGKETGYTLVVQRLEGTSKNGPSAALPAAASPRRTC